MIKATFCELHIHADTYCFGNECQVLNGIGQADVTGFRQDLGQITGAKIITAAVVYDDQENGIHISSFSIRFYSYQGWIIILSIHFN